LHDAGKLEPFKFKAHVMKTQFSQDDMLQNGTNNLYKFQRLHLPSIRELHFHWRGFGFSNSLPLSRPSLGSLLLLLPLDLSFFSLGQNLGHIVQNLSQPKSQLKQVIIGN
jgi:hypothetical protein